MGEGGEERGFVFSVGEREMRICPNPFLTDRPAQLRIVVITRIIINTGHLKMSLVVAGRNIFPKRLVVAVK